MYCLQSIIISQLCELVGWYDYFSHYQESDVEVLISESQKCLLVGSSDCDTKENHLFFFFLDSDKIQREFEKCLKTITI